MASREMITRWIVTDAHFFWLACLAAVVALLCVPEAEAAECPALTVAHGTVQVTGHSVDSTVQITCQSGYQLTGTTPYQCQLSISASKTTASWHGNQACSVINNYCSLDVSLGGEVYYQKPGGLSVGSKAVMICNNSGTVSGHRVFLCKAYSATTGRWVENVNYCLSSVRQTPAATTSSTTVIWVIISILIAIIMLLVFFLTSSYREIQSKKRVAAIRNAVTAQNAARAQSPDVATPTAYARSQTRVTLMGDNALGVGTARPPTQQINRTVSLGSVHATGLPLDATHVVGSKTRQSPLRTMLSNDSGSVSIEEEPDTMRRVSEHEMIMLKRSPSGPSAPSLPESRRDSVSPSRSMATPPISGSSMPPESKSLNACFSATPTIKQTAAVFAKGRGLGEAHAGYEFPVDMLHSSFQATPVYARPGHRHSIAASSHFALQPSRSTGGMFPTGSAVASRQQQQHKHLRSRSQADLRETVPLDMRWISRSGRSSVV